MKRIYLLGFTFCFFISFGQKEAYVWHFGDGITMDFKQIPPAISKKNNMNAFEGCASVSDSAGNILFYTNGEKIWSKNDSVMENGDSLWGYISSGQSSIIIPTVDTNNCNNLLYYVFTCDGGTWDPIDSIWGMQYKGVMAYSIVDMSANDGLGKVTLKNMPVLDTVNENIAAIRHANGRDTWIVTHKYNTQDYYAYLLTIYGNLLPPVVSPVGKSYPSTPPANLANMIKFSADGKKLAHARTHIANGWELFDFDNSTGVLSNPKYFPATPSFYGFCFSPNGKYIYLTDSKFYKLLQYDLEAGTVNDIVTGATIIYQGSSSADFDPQDMQLGPDGKIYFICHQYDGKIGVIHDPNQGGLACNYEHNIYTQAGIRSAFPNFVQDFLSPYYQGVDYKKYFGTHSEIISNFSIGGNNCKNEIHTFDATASSLSILTYQWLIDDLLIDSTAFIDYSFPDTGSYEIKLIMSNQCVTDSTTKVVWIQNCLDSISNDHPVEVFIPNALSLNNDQVNEEMKIHIPSAQKIELCIFNREGKTIYKTYGGQEIYWTPDEIDNFDVFMYALTVTFSEHNVSYYKGNLLSFK